MTDDELVYMNSKLSNEDKGGRNQFGWRRVILDDTSRQKQKVHSNMMKTSKRQTQVRTKNFPQSHMTENINSQMLGEQCDHGSKAMAALKKLNQSINEALRHGASQDKNQDTRSFLDTAGWTCWDEMIERTTIGCHGVFEAKLGMGPRMEGNAISETTLQY